MRPIKKITHVHKLMAHYLAMGWSVQQIAEELKYTPHYVNQIANDDRIKALVAEDQRRINEYTIDKETTRRAQITSAMNEEAMNAFNTVKSLHRGSAVDSVRLRAAQDILNRAPEAPKLVTREERDDVHRILLEGKIMDRLLYGMEKVDAEIPALPIGEEEKEER